MMTLMSLLTMAGCAGCWAGSIYLILVRRFSNKGALLRYNRLVLSLMLVNLAICLPALIRLVGRENGFALRFLLILATVTDLLSTAGLLLFSLYGLLVTQQTLPKGIDDIVILGAATHEGKVPPVLASRLQYGIRCWQNNPGAQIIVTGGTVHGERTSEAAAMTDYLIAQGTPAGQIIQEPVAKNTWQNLRLSKQLVSSSAARVIVVTSNFHVWRVKGYLKQLGSAWQVRGARTPAAHCPLTFVRDYLGNIRDHRKLAAGLLVVLVLVCEVVLR